MNTKFAKTQHKSVSDQHFFFKIIEAIIEWLWINTPRLYNTALTIKNFM